MKESGRTQGRRVAGTVHRHDISSVECESKHCVKKFHMLCSDASTSRKPPNSTYIAVSIALPEAVGIRASKAL